MNNKLLILTALLLSLNSAIAQTKTITITVDASELTGQIPISNYLEWQGDASYVPAVINHHMPSWENMGAEYIIFSNDGDVTNPNNDSVPGSRQKLWRSRAMVHNKQYVWSFESNEPRIITNESLLKGSYLIVPGDSIHIKYNQNSPVFSGRGASKLQVLYQIREAFTNVKYSSISQKPSNRSLDEYLNRNHYLNEQLTRTTSILTANHARLSHYEYDWIKSYILSLTEYKRWLYFTFAWHAKQDNPKLSFTISDLISAWDSTMYKPDACWFRSPHVQNLPGIGILGYTESFHTTEMRRKFNFLKPDSVNNSPVFKKLIYQKLKSSYTGLYRERLLCYFLAEEIIQEMMAPYNWFAQSIMNDYYSTPGFVAYKTWMKQLEKSKKIRYEGISSVGHIPLFNLKNQVDSNYTQQSTKEKVTVINFWYSGCEPCKQSAKTLEKLIDKYKTDTCIIFLNISTDSIKSTWEKSITEGVYVPKKGVHLYTGGLGKNHPALSDFNVSKFPTIRLYDQTGLITIDPSHPFADNYALTQLEEITGKHLVIFEDGPYIFFRDGKPLIYSISNTNKINIKSTKQLTSATDQYAKKITFSLQKKESPPKTYYPEPSRMLVMSDIEGNFFAFRKLLQANNVIDNNFNWKFGSGHLVLVGDMFDRGDQVTECLWLIYSLEKKAKAQGGHVHFILGNHELMNLIGNDNYVTTKYKRNYTLLGKKLTQVYGEDSELGRWLRTKNIVEKIGDNLFCHGGISSELNKLPVTLENINQLARPHYANYKENYENEILNIIMSNSKSPFWYRGYYSSKQTEQLIDSTLQKFNVAHIITGHTIIADTISIRFNGKIINTDVHHASGKSEALLIENDSYYRVSPVGTRILLFRGNKYTTTLSLNSR